MIFDLYEEKRYLLGTIEKGFKKMGDENFKYSVEIPPLLRYSKKFTNSSDKERAVKRSEKTCKKSKSTKGSYCP